jgi:hypothetical protein
MHDAAQVIGFFAAALLIIAIAAWLKLYRPRLQRLDGRRSPSDDDVEIASRLLVVALCVCGVAALFAVIGLFAA